MSEEIQPQERPMEILKIESFIDNGGKAVDVHLRVNEDLEPVEIVRIIGHASIQVTQRAPDGQTFNQMVPVDFEIPTTSVHEAFLEFEEAAKRAAVEVGAKIKKSHEEQRKKVHILPPGSPLPPPDMRRLPRDGKGPLKRPFLG